MKKILFILAALIFSSFSLSAQWTCETLDPEFDDAMKIAYIHDNNGNGLTIGEYCSIWQYNNWVSQQLSIADFLFNLLEYDYTGQYDWINTVSDMKDALKAGAFPDSWVDFTSEAGNIPVVLAVEGKYYCGEDDYCSVYSFEISFKIGESYKKYRNYSMSERMIPLDEDEIVVSYEYDRKDRVGNYYIEWPSKEFWKDFRAASSVKIRIKQSAKSEYQYYEFNMSGSTKAFNYVTTDHKVYWLEDWLENLIELEEKKQETRKWEKQESTKPDWQSEYEAEKQRYMASHTPPHELKLECKSRHLVMEHPHFELYPLSNSVICDSRYDFFDVGYDTILNMLNLCPCLDDQISDIDMNHELYSKSFDWNLDGIHILGNDSKEIVVPFESIPQYKWDKRYCASLYSGDNAALWGTEAIDSLEKYQLIWTQNPLKLIVKEHDKTLEFVVQDWGVDGEWMHGQYNFNWYYRVLSEYGEEYVVSFDDYVKDWDDIENVEYLSNIGNVLLFDHWKKKIPANIFFRHTDIHAYDVFEIKK